MSIDLKTTSVEPVRDTFDHLAAKLGPGKKPSRYQEGVWGLQPQLNFHYRPTWDPGRELYDPRRSAIEMADYDELVDPRQYYYGSWTIHRGRQQDAQEKSFDLVAKRGLLDGLDEIWKARLRALVVPVRHVAWAANTNNCYIAAYGYGAPLTSACSMHMMDHLGVAQYVSRIALILDDNDTAGLDAAKQAWLGDPLWQPLRELVETSMVTRDWCELFVLQNLLIDGTVHPLVFDHFGAELAVHGGAAFSMLCEFMVDWHAESSRWVDAVVRRVAAESARNRELLAGWLARWAPRVRDAAAPLAELAFGERAAAIGDALAGGLADRARKCGLDAQAGARAS